MDEEFHTWDFPLSKFKYAKFLNEPYAHLAVTSDSFDRNGPRSHTINVPIPKNNKKTLKI